jgi:hypothetical protein
MKQVSISIAAAALAALALSTPVQAQACGAGSHATAVSVTGSLGPNQPPWTNLQIQVPQFVPVAGQRLIQADLVVAGGVSGLILVEDLSPNFGCTATWCLASTIDVTLLAPGASPLELTPHQCGSNDLAAFDGTIDFSGPSGATNNLATTFQTATVTITDPGVLASVFTGSGEVNFTTSASDRTSVAGCGSSAWIVINHSLIVVDVVYTYCGAGVTMCVPGDLGTVACPCGNPQSPAGSIKGCDNSSATGGAKLDSGGAASLSADTVVFTTSGERPTATSVVLQGDSLTSSGTTFGQGVRCAGGTLVRLYTKTAISGSIVAPGPADPSVSARSAALGDTIGAGQTRWYLVYYRDPNVLGGCPASSTFNATQGQAIAWQM